MAALATAVSILASGADAFMQAVRVLPHIRGALRAGQVLSHVYPGKRGTDWQVDQLTRLPINTGQLVQGCDVGEPDGVSGPPSFGAWTML